jgi:hypothetical protein
MVGDISIRRIYFALPPIDRWWSGGFKFCSFTGMNNDFLYIYLVFCHFNSCVRPERARSSKRLLFFPPFHCGDGPHLSQCWRISLIIGREGDGVVGPHWLARCPFSFNQRKFSLFLFLILELGAWRLVVFRIQPSSSIQFFFRFSSNCSRTLFICATFSTFFKTSNWLKLWSIAFVHPTDKDRFHVLPPRNHPMTNLIH